MKLCVIFYNEDSEEFDKTEVYDHFIALDEEDAMDHAKQMILKDEEHPDKGFWWIGISDLPEKLIIEKKYEFDVKPFGKQDIDFKYLKYIDSILKSYDKRVSVVNYPSNPEWIEKSIDTLKNVYGFGAVNFKVDTSGYVKYTF